MMRRSIVVLGVALIPALASAQSTGMYKCVDKSGAVTYQNIGVTKGMECTKTEGQPITTVAPPAKPAPKAADKNATPANFPKVDERLQRNRDEERKKILEDELDQEEKRLADLQKEYKGGQPDRLGGERNYQKYLDRTEQLKQDIQRSEQNIEALKKELAK
ncbi:MAG: DUF4124 domain-containing protein [Burkholderiaceae bacterium]|nr:MAG: DUF4124 domain-containing protein [Burkholderiaceae bacterium]